MKKTLLVLTVLTALHLFFLANLRFTAWPEMLSYPYLYNNGFSLYRDMIYPYPPFLTGMLAVWYSCFGYGLGSVKVFTWMLIIISDLLIFGITRRITKSDRFALIAVVIYVFLQPFLGGNMLWFDLAIVPFVLAGTYFAIRSFEKDSRWTDFALVGYFLIVSSLVKQTAGFFFIIYLVYAFFATKDRRKYIYTFLAPLTLGLVLLAKLIATDLFVHFFNWILWFPMTSWSSFPGYVQMGLTQREFAKLVFLLAPVIAGLVAYRKIVLRDKNVILLTMFLAGSLIAVYPRFSFFHFQLALALVAIMYGILASYSKSTRRVVILYTVVLLLFVFVQVSSIKQDWNKEARFYDENDMRLASQIKEIVPEAETVFLLGVHSGHYVYSDRLPPKPWTDNFGWYLEIPGLQDKIIKSWESDPPYAVVWSEPSEGDWYDLGVYQPTDITKWIIKNYNMEGELEKGVTIWLKRN